MPHQCLKCGSVFADGSPEILRGCPECKGTRFFYTEKALPDEERNRLKEQATKDIKYLIREMMTGETQPMDIQKVGLEKDEWVSLGARSKAEPGKAEGPRKIKVGKDMVKSVEDLVFKEKDASKKFRIASKADDHKQVKETVISQKAAKEKVSKGPEAKTPKKEQRVDVISIIDDGVYDIDVEKLLENSPIIMQRDGSYLVHLPSVFKKVGKKKSAA